MKKIMKNAIFTILFSVLIILALFLAYLFLYASNDRNLSGKWTADLDMTGQAAVTALGWLQDMEAVSVSLQDMEARMQGLTVKLDLTLEQTARSGGTFVSTVQQESYAACSQAHAARFFRMRQYPDSGTPVRLHGNLYRASQGAGHAQPVPAGQHL
jgi:hypothetical protein